MCETFQLHLQSLSKLKLASVIHYAEEQSAYLYRCRPTSSISLEIDFDFVKIV